MGLTMTEALRADATEPMPGELPPTDEVYEGERGLPDDTDAARGDDVAGGDLATEGGGGV